MHGERDAVLIVSKLAFKEGSMWTFFEQGGTVVAKIEDEEFWRDVHQRAVTFGEGDRLKVHLHWEVIEKKGKLTPRNKILKVYQVLERPKQMQLDGGKDDEITKDPPSRRIRIGLVENVNRGPCSQAAIVHTQAGRNDDAIREALAVLKGAPDFIPALTAMAEAYERKGNYSHLLGLARVAAARDDRVEMLMEQAHDHTLLGSRQKARAEFDEAEDRSGATYAITRCQSGVVLRSPGGQGIGIFVAGPRTR
jgi:predicted metalloprotease